MEWVQDIFQLSLIYDVVINDLANSLQEMISSISGRIPVTVEETIRRHLSNYASNITSVLSQFPSQQVNYKNVVLIHFYDIDCTG